jgi:hypothetical protein
MFINDLCSCIRFSKFHLYTDNLQIYLSGDRKELDEMIWLRFLDGRLRMGCYLAPTSSKQF